MEYSNQILNDDELQHWGIRGMKWGIRRYQNKDGSLTAAGKKKYKAEMEKVKKDEADLKRRQATKAKLDKLMARKAAVKKGNDDLDEAEGKKIKEKIKKGNKDGKKDMKDMTDEELNAHINRLRLEQQYKQLNPDPAPKKSWLVNDVMKPAVINSGKKFLEKWLDKAGAKMLGDAVKEIDYDKEMKKLNYEARKKLAQAQDEGHASWSSRQATKKAEAEAAAKVKADDDARKANEAKSYEYYNSGYRNAGKGERTEVGSSSSSANKGKSAIAGLLGDGGYSSQSSTSLVKSSSVNTGKSAVAGLLGDGKLDAVYSSMNDDGTFGEWRT